MSGSLDLAEAALRATSGDDAEVVVHAERSGVARFAASIVHQPTLIENSVVRVRVLRDGKIGWAATNRVDGRSYSVSGSPSCSYLPLFITAMRLDIVIASSWSWVT